MLTISISGDHLADVITSLRHFSALTVCCLFSNAPDEMLYKLVSLLIFVDHEQCRQIARKKRRHVRQNLCSLPIYNRQYNAVHCSQRIATEFLRQSRGR